MADKSESHYFYKLLKLNTKKVRYQHHHEFLRRCQDQDIIPDGLRLYKQQTLVGFRRDLRTIGRQFFRVLWDQCLGTGTKWCCVVVFTL